MDCGANAELGLRVISSCLAKTYLHHVYVSQPKLDTVRQEREVAGYFNNKFLGELGFFSMKVALYLEDFFLMIEED